MTHHVDLLWDFGAMQQVRRAAILARGADHSPSSSKDAMTMEFGLSAPVVRPGIHGILTKINAKRSAL